MPDTPYNRRHLDGTPKDPADDHAEFAKGKEIREIRRKRIEGIMDGYELSAGEFDGHMENPQRYVLITESNRGFGYFATSVNSPIRASQKAAANIHENWWPVCIYDLDELDGDEPLIYDGDVVKYGDDLFMVDHVEEELIEGEVGRYLCLLEGEGGRESTRYDDYDERVHEDEVEIVERVEEEKRNPVRYGLAHIQTVVAFNTIPSPA